jgi:hypothetical protein
VATNASSNSFALVVENAAVFTVVLGEVGFTLTCTSIAGGFELDPAGLTVNVAVPEVPEYAAVINELEVEATEFVLTVNVAVLLPPATVTLAGTVAAAVLLLESVTDVPAVGAGALNVTVAVELLPPVTLAGFNVNV